MSNVAIVYPPAVIKGYSWLQTVKMWVVQHAGLEKDALHIYFALRPEKLLFTRAMLRGWITRAEYSEHHDPQRWQVER